MIRGPWLIRGIRDKLLVAFTTLVAAIAIFVFLFFPARLERQAFRATVAKTDAIRDMAAYSLAAGLLFSDDEAVAEVLAGAAASENISFLAVWNDSGRLVAARGAAAALSSPLGARAQGGISADGRDYVSTTVVTSGTTGVGTLSVGMSLASLRDEVASSRRISAIASLLIFGVGLLVIYAMSTLITRPLTAVALTVDRIAAGDLTLRATETPDVEVAQLVRAFNRMVDTLVGSQGELAVLNSELETRVAARTAELTAAVGELRQSQAALVLSEGAARRTSSLLQALIDVAPQAIVATDAEWLVTGWSHGAERLFGWTASEVLGRPLPYIPPEQASDVAAAQLAVEQGTGTGPMEVTRMRKDGTVFSALLGVGIMRDANRRPTGSIGFFTDLTERKRLEEQLRQSQKMDAMGRLAGGVAHDFNNILTVITSCSELMLHEPRSAADQAQLEQIAAAAARAARLTRQLLAFTRQQVIQFQVVDVRAIIRDLEPMLRRVLPANVHFTTCFDPAAGAVLADPTQLEQITMNLVVNGADAMKQGGALRLAVERADAPGGRVNGDSVPPGVYTVLSVEDTGTGIDEPTIARMFDPFFTTKGLGKGTGLGLSTTYGVVAGMNGAIRVQSTLGKGTTFRVYLPETSERIPVVAPAPPPRRLTPTGLRPIVLLVEDEPAVQRIVKLSLQREGYEVWVAGSGEEALEIARDRGDQLSVVVTDMMMPGMTGRAFADALGVRFPKMGVVFVSGYMEAVAEPGETLTDARHVFLQKPFTRAELAAAIRTVSPKPG